MATKVTTKHNCLAEIREEIKKNDASIQYVEFELSTITNLFKEPRIFKTGQGVVLGETKTRKDGTTYEKRRKTFIAHTYCPFCGKKY